MTSFNKHREKPTLISVGGIRGSGWNIGYGMMMMTLPASFGYQDWSSSMDPPGLLAPRDDHRSLPWHPQRTSPRVLRHRPLLGFFDFLYNVRVHIHAQCGSIGGKKSQIKVSQRLVRKYLPRPPPKCPGLHGEDWTAVDTLRTRERWWCCLVVIV